MTFEEAAGLTNVEYDQAIRDGEGVRFLCGVDEAGRGPLAGPVYAAAVILSPDRIPEGLDDSKKLSEKRRELLYDRILASASAWCVASASVEEIEEINILQATYRAMQRAVEGLTLLPDLILVDGNRRPPGLAGSVRTIVKGDALSASIAAASILAKVSRDRLMTELDRRYPEYAFAKHKGYGTALHMERIRTYGPSPVHRLSFLKKIG